MPELQRRGIYWMDYPVVGGTFRENLQGKPGNSYLDPTHPGAKHRNAEPRDDSANVKLEHKKREKVNGSETHRRSKRVRTSL